ncbi:hypothetical protein C7460_104115 [Marinoscillum furvescens DSM 4134]|uniref:Uncharacterized protein n=1 Tax=Marinoscillum furvescens DSM 4134 TaxID=1122208 RepID=A0A3D9L4Z4_MARFU|nr:hypothetical protein C7460_104115 [Marinoscillum furvescens DSM 4134]
MGYLDVLVLVLMTALGMYLHAWVRSNLKK